MKMIGLTQGKFALVDDSDYELLSRWRWRVSPDGYAIRHSWDKATKRYVTIRMHRLIAGTPKNLKEDHISGNRLDNRRKNLRSCTHTENMRNTSSNRGGSKYKGVCRDVEHDRWKAYIMVDGKQLHLGSFKDERTAAESYDRAAAEYFGEYARLNVLLREKGVLQFKSLSSTIIIREH